MSYFVGKVRMYGGLQEHSCEFEIGLSEWRLLGYREVCDLRSGAFCRCKELSCLRETGTEVGRNDVEYLAGIEMAFTAISNFKALDYLILVLVSSFWRTADTDVGGEVFVEAVKVGGLTDVS
jgi:hypothetical protein